MGKKLVFHKGVRLWEVLKLWKPIPTPRGGDERIGISRKFASLTSRHRNFLYDITVHTHMAVPASVVGDLGLQATHNVGMLSVMKALIDNNVDGTLGDLSWVDDDDRMIAPSGSSGAGTYPRQETVPYTGSGFTPAVGDKVLIREPVGGAGWVSHVYAATAGVSLRVDLQQAIDATWEIFKVFAYFPSTEFITVGGWENTSQAEDKHSPDVIYSFKAAAHPVWSTAYNRDLS